jgi:hypothetical protein
MTKLWLTYAWKDNQDQDVDHVVQELQKVGLEVAFDRAHIIPRQRLWPQIDKGISDPATDAWAILATRTVSAVNLVSKNLHMRLIEHCEREVQIFR